MKKPGIFQHIIFHNEENGYTVARFYSEEEDTEIIAVGYTISPQAGQEVELTGEPVFHPKFGEQFAFTHWESKMPEERQGILRYLSSGALPHIGPAMAEKIVEKFGEDTFTILEKSPERLMEISGIGEKKWPAIAQAFQEGRDMRQLMIFTKSFDISPGLTATIHKRYGIGAMEIIKNNPYRLAEDIPGIGFKTVDGIGEKLGMAKDDPRRMQGAVSAVMSKGIQSGHCYLPFEEVERRVEKLLGLASGTFTLSMEDTAMDPKYFVSRGEEGFRLYYSGMYRWETFVGRNLHERLKEEKRRLQDSDRELFAGLEKRRTYTAAPEQIQALHFALQYPVMILTGGPGTGKTTTLKDILALFEGKGKKVALAAPTGRAAKRMEEATGRQASTIHRLMALTPEQDNPADFSPPEEEEKIQADVLIIDEVSMVDLPLFYRLLEALEEKTTLILVGDKDQLPSVGPGNLLGDLIASQAIPVVELTRVFRQERDSQIVANAHRVNRGEFPELNRKGGDFFFLERSKEETPEEILSLVEERLPEFFSINGKEDIQVLSPMRGGICGVENLNRLLQERLNPKTGEKKEVVLFGRTYREGDKVMQVKNNYRLRWESQGDLFDLSGEGVFNGDCGRILRIDEENRTLTVLFDDVKKVKYEFGEVDELNIAYATTIHKSQGSEYPVVVIPMQWAPPMLLTRPLLYTAITRAKSGVVLVGKPGYLKAMVDNDYSERRYTALGEILQRLKEEEE